jgi:hypothetical protein
VRTSAATVLAATLGLASVSAQAVPLQIVPVAGDSSIVKVA